MAVYMIGNKEHGVVKIGYSRDASGVPSRLSSLQTGSHIDLEVLAVFDEATQQDERALHALFENIKTRDGGEWFRLFPEMVAHAKHTIERRALADFEYGFKTKIFLDARGRGGFGKKEELWFDPKSPHRFWPDRCFYRPGCRQSFGMALCSGFIKSCNECGGFDFIRRSILSKKKRGFYTVSYAAVTKKVRKMNGLLLWHDRGQLPPWKKHCKCTGSLEWQKDAADRAGRALNEIMRRARKQSTAATASSPARCNRSRADGHRSTGTVAPTAATS